MGKKTISQDIKQRIIGLNMGGHSNIEISRILKSVSPSCVSRTITKFKQTGSTADKKRSGRPRMTSITDDNSIYRIARKNPKFSAKQIAQEINLALKNQISRKTVNRRLIDRKLWYYVAARKPLLKPKDRLKRIKFCKAIKKKSNRKLMNYNKKKKK